MFRKPGFVIVAAVALYALALAFAWQQGTARAERRVELMLEAAATGYGQVIHGEIEAALRYAGGAIANVLGGECRAHSLARMQELAKTFNVDEVNLVDLSGIVVASNIDSVRGFDFSTNSLTAAFLALTNDATTLISQPFRRGVANPDLVCKYYGMAMPKRNGIIQLGITPERLRQNMYVFSEEESRKIHREWHFSVEGWYIPASDDPDFAEGRIFRRYLADEGVKVIGRYFTFNGFRYMAVLPESYCYVQRNAAFAVTALVLGVLLAFFAFFLVRLNRASAKLEAMHRAADARMAADLALAQKIQDSALPNVTGALADCLEYTLAAESYPAREVGGDFYDFYALDADHLVLVIADVSGKGIPGALFMMEAKNVIRESLQLNPDLAEAVAKANARLCRNNKAELFVTAWIGILDRTGRIEYVNAGHNRPFVRHADGRVDKVTGRGGLFLGMFDGASYRTGLLKLAPGDLLYLYTDGVTEAMDHDRRLFGEARLVQALGAGAPVSEAVSAFVAGAERSDDITTLSVRWYGAPHRTERTFPAGEESLAATMAFLREALAGIDGKTTAALLNAADEIAANIVGYSGAAEFEVAVERAPDRVRIVFADAGREYNPLSHADPDTHAKLEDRPVGGLGLVVVKRLVERVTYAREDGRNVLCLLQHLAAPATT